MTSSENIPFQMEIKMNLFMTFCALLAASATAVNPFRAAYPVHYPAMVQNGVDPGQPLFLTPYLDKGEIQKGQLLW